MNGAEWAGVILGSIGTVTGLGGLVYARRSAKASEQSAQAAKEAVDHQLETTRKANTARVVRHEPLGFARDGSTVKFGLRMYNEGPAPAHNLQMFISWPGNDPDNERDPRTRERASKTIYALQPFNGDALIIPIEKAFGAMSGHLNCRVVYEDGNGPHELRWWLMVQGRWDERWLQGIEDPQFWP